MRIRWYVTETMSQKTQATNRSMTKQFASQKTLTERVEDYDMLSSLAQANSGINIDKILWGEAKEVEAMARKL